MQPAEHAPAEAGQPSAWDALAERLNPGYDRPRVCAGIVERRLVTSRGEPYYILKNPRAGTYVRVEPDQYFLVGLMDGSRQVKDLVLAYFLEYQRLAFQRIAHLVAELRQHRFLEETPRDAWAGLTNQLARRTWTGRVDRVLRGFMYREFPVHGLDGVVTEAYRRFGRAFFTPVGISAIVVLSLLGVALFLSELLQVQRDPLRSGGSYSLGLLVVILLSLATVSLHELGHALATKHYGREVPRGGFMIYYGLPAFFVDTSDIWLEPRRARIVVSAAGMLAVWALGGLAMLYVVLWPQAELAPLAFQLAFVAFVNNSLNLLPLLELDGYYILMDWLEIPLLRARALAFVRRDLPRKIRVRERLNREERILAIFGSLALVYSLYALVAVVYFWSTRLQQFLAEAWSQEAPLLRALVVLLIGLFGVPLLIGLVLKLLQLLRAVTRGAFRLRWRPIEARARARLQARELVSRLPFLAGADFASREAVVRQLRTRRFGAGEPVVREGEPGEAFFLIRSGEAEVVRLAEDGWPRQLTVLRQGDHFGELALLYDQPRLATVRALTSLEVYVLDRETFQRTIAPRMREYGLSVERIVERSELAQARICRQMAPTELDQLLEHLERQEFLRGAEIVRQGEAGDRFYIIRSGRVEVVRRDGQQREQVLAVLQSGDYFGEMALLSDMPRSATVRAIEPVLTWSLDKPAFEKLLLGQLQLHDVLSGEAERRQATTRRLAGERVA